MEKNHPVQKPAAAWISLIGVILILMGIYGGVRTAINLSVFAKYPSTGVFNFNFAGVPMFTQKEEDCDMTSYYGGMTGLDGNPMPPEEARAEIEKQKQSCLRSVTDSREQAKVNDISQSSLFLFLGIGVLAARRFIF